MATVPQPPLAPPPPRKGGHILAIVLLVLALVVLVSASAVLIGLRFLSRVVQVHVDEGRGGKKGVSINTPAGKVFSLEVNKEVSEAALGLPIYPGSKRVKDEDSAMVNIGVPGEQKVRVVAAKFETSDPIDKVTGFYRGRLGSQVTKFTEKDSEGKTVIEIEHNDQEKIVALKGIWPGTRIELVRVEHAEGESN